jgi:hypothetical protein
VEPQFEQKPRRTPGDDSYQARVPSVSSDTRSFRQAVNAA